MNCRIRITLTDGRTMLGQLLAYDKHLNLVIADCEEFRVTKKQAKRSNGAAAESGGLGEMRRTLGLVLLRGETVVSMIPEGDPPPASGNKARVPAAKQMAPGMRMGGPGLPPPGAPPSGLAGPIPGMYGPPPTMMPGMMPPSMYPPPGYPYPPPGPQ